MGNTFLRILALLTLLGLVVPRLVAALSQWLLASGPPGMGEAGAAQGLRALAGALVRQLLALLGAGN